MKTKQNLRGHRLYNIWHNMKRRCNASYMRDYIRYGGRGIKVCERWLVFSNFIEDMYPTFKEGLSLDRVDSNGDYGPENCKWSTTEQQLNNRKCTTKIIFNNKCYTEAQLSREFNIPRTTLRWRRLNGWTVEEMLFGK